MVNHGPPIITISLAVALVTLLVLPVPGLGQEEAVVASDQCVACHSDLEVLPHDYIVEDVHMKAGLGCAGCHGGDPMSDDDEVAMSPKAGYVGAPAKKDISKFCGKCHSDIEFMRRYQPRIPTDQASQYATSVHGIRLARGDENVADCTSCHTAHGILAVKDSRSSVYALNVPATCNKCHGDAKLMSGYGIRTDQYEKYAQSVHGKALLENQDVGAPACNDCHGNHGAMPPGITSVRQVCGHCHVNNMQFFTASKMGAAFDREELHGCEECHGNHDVKRTADDMVGIGDAAVCIDCHDEGDKGYETAGKISGLLTALTTVYDQAETKREEVSRIGMDDEEIGFVLQEAHQSLIQARTLVHTFDDVKVGVQTSAGTAKAQEALDLAIEQIQEHGVRRRGFGLATIFITILVIALFLKIRQLPDS
ncbi:MAG: cytochrome c3 family protein [Candidatus Krumholzibacteria bacterium]